MRADSCAMLLQLGNLYGLLGSLYAERASSQPGALQSRYKKQVNLPVLCWLCTMQCFPVDWAKVRIGVCCATLK